LLVADSPFAKELKEAGIIDRKKYAMLKFQNQRTIHFTLNGLISSYESRDHQERNFIIIEPFEEHVNDESLMNINEADTYFQEDMVLSERATILIKAEKYKDLIKDEKMLKELNKMDIRLFEGNEEEAVRMCLLDKGYTFGEIHKWGFESHSDIGKPKAQNEVLIGKAEEAIANKLKEQGKNVKYGGVYFNSESKRIDEERKVELLEEELKLFVECIADVANFEFSKTSLMNELLSREYIPKEAKFEEGDKDKPNIEVKELLEKLTTEGLEKATKKYNETITQEHMQARKVKDEQLKQRGLIIEKVQVEEKEER
jgi:virulence-associated protein VapD